MSLLFPRPRLTHHSRYRWNHLGGWQRKYTTLLHGTPFWVWAGLPSSDLVFLGHSPVCMDACYLWECQLKEPLFWLIQEADTLPIYSKYKVVFGQAGTWKCRKIIPPYQCYVHLPLLNLHLSMTLRLRVLPENLVTSKNLEKSKGHWKRAKSTSCSFTAWRERRSCVYGACSRKREPVFLSEFWFAWSRVNQEQVFSRRLLAAPCCKWCQRYLRKFTLGRLRAQSFTQLRLPVGMWIPDFPQIPIDWSESSTFWVPWQLFRYYFHTKIVLHPMPILNPFKETLFRDLNILHTFQLIVEPCMKEWVERFTSLLLLFGICNLRCFSFFPQWTIHKWKWGRKQQLVLECGYPAVLDKSLTLACA